MIGGHERNFCQRGSHRGRPMRARANAHARDRRLRRGSIWSKPADIERHRQRMLGLGWERQPDAALRLQFATSRPLLQATSGRAPASASAAAISIVVRSAPPVSSSGMICRMERPRRISWLGVRPVELCRIRRPTVVTTCISGLEPDNGLCQIAPPLVASCPKTRAIHSFRTTRWNKHNSRDCPKLRGALPH